MSETPSFIATENQISVADYRGVAFFCHSACTPEFCCRTALSFVPTESQRSQPLLVLINHIFPCHFVLLLYSVLQIVRLIGCLVIVLVSFHYYTYIFEHLRALFLVGAMKIFDVTGTIILGGNPPCPLSPLALLIISCVSVTSTRLVQAWRSISPRVLKIRQFSIGTTMDCFTSTLFSFT